jgi:hypothetical protein
VQQDRILKPERADHSNRMSRPQNSPNSNLPSEPLGSTRPDGERGDQTNLHERVCRVLEETNTPISVSRLAERLHATDDREYAEVHDALYRTHLQRLDAADRLVFDMEMGLVYDQDASLEELRDGCSA